MQAPQPVESPVQQAPVYHEPTPAPQQHYEQPAPLPVARHDVLVQPAAPRRAQRGEPVRPEPSPAENKRRTLLERLAAFGMSKAEETIQPARPAAPQIGHQPPRAPNPVHSEYGKRPAAPAPRAQQGLDHHGRPMQPSRAIEDDQLEIPAFLRRQSN
jgi:cell division protein FtsZ